MIYRTNSDLPDSIRELLPEQAQDIYRETFNFAYAANCGADDREKSAHLIAFAQVKRSFAKDGHRWVPKQRSSASS